MLQIFLENLWTMTLIIACVAIIVFLLAVMYAIVIGIKEGIEHKKIKDKTLKELQDNFDKFIEDLENQDKEKKE